MMQLPPGCTVNYPITIDVKSLTPAMVKWFITAGGYTEERDHYNHRGTKVTNTYVRYGKAKFCHYRVDGTGAVRLHFFGEDASVATMFLLTFSELIEVHNMRDHYSLA